MPREVMDARLEQLFAALPENENLAIYENTDVQMHSSHQLMAIEEFIRSGIGNSILLNVVQSGFKRPTNVQNYAIAYVLAGNDVTVTAQTVSGMTAAGADWPAEERFGCCTCPNASERGGSRHRRAAADIADTLTCRHVRV
jgi:hypothetical protein